MARLTLRQQLQYKELGYYFPVPVLQDSEVMQFRSFFFDYLSANRERLKQLPMRKQYLVFSQTHAVLRWVYRIVSHPNVLDAVESVLGPNLLVWDTGWFSKMPGEGKYVAWHQDSLYFGLHPPHLTTAWIALTESIPENGCLRVIPRSHERVFSHRETESQGNLLSRGQEIAVEVHESEAVDLNLKPGQLSLHHVGIVHGSNVNGSDIPRIGLAVRYLTPDVTHQGSRQQFAMLVRGEDNLGHFELLPPPGGNGVSIGSSIQAKILERMGLDA